jgi:E3 ubiquitin-protein transferase RMND5
MLSQVDNLCSSLSLTDDATSAAAILTAPERARVIDTIKGIFTETKAKEFQRKDESAAIARLCKQFDKATVPALASFEDLLEPLLQSDRVRELSAFDGAFVRSLCDAVVAYLAHSGRLDSAELLCRETNMPDHLVSHLAQFRTLHSIVSELSQRRLHLALQWASEHAAGDSLLFQLHQVAFLELLCDPAMPRSECRAAALRYGRAHFAPFAKTHWKRVGYLFSAALYVDANANADVDMVDDEAPRGLAASPYAKLLVESADMWQRAAVAVSVAFARVCGLQETPALVVVLRCAWPVVPALTKLVTLKQRGMPVDASTVSLPLAQNERYHTVFACPVTRAQSAPTNPPTMLPCRHVLARDSAAQLVNRSGMIKCPYCPMQTTLANCKQLHF